MKNKVISEFSVVLFFLILTLIPALPNYNKIYHITVISITFISIFLFSLFKISNFNLNIILRFFFTKIKENKYLFSLILFLFFYILIEMLIAQNYLIIFFLLYPIAYLLLLITKDFKFNNSNIFIYIIFIYLLSFFLEILILDKSLFKIFTNFYTPFLGPFLNKNISAVILFFVFLVNNNKNLKDLFLLFIFLLLMKSLLALVLFLIFIFNNILSVKYKNFILCFSSFFVIIIVYLIFPREADIDRLINYFYAIELLLAHSGLLGLGTSGSIGFMISGVSIGLESSLFYFFNDFYLFAILLIFYEFFFYKKFQITLYFLPVVLVSGIAFSPFFFISYLLLVKFYHDKTN